MSSIYMLQVTLAHEEFDMSYVHHVDDIDALRDLARNMMRDARVLMFRTYAIGEVHVWSRARGWDAAA